jgi:hypothetical protein
VKVPFWAVANGMAESTTTRTPNIVRLKKRSNERKGVAVRDASEKTALVTPSRLPPFIKVDPMQIRPVNLMLAFDIVVGISTLHNRYTYCLCDE